MTERSWFWEGIVLGDCGPYGLTEFDRHFRIFLGSSGDRGVLLGWLDELEVSGVASPLSVATGAGAVYGLFYHNDAAVSVAVPTPSSGYSRYDRIVLRRTWTAQQVRIARVSGVAGLTPAIPALTQTAGDVYEVPLATALINDTGAIVLTDDRAYCAMPSNWPTVGGVLTQHIADGAVDTDAIPDRTRYNLIDAGQLEPDSASPAAWTVGASYDYWSMAAGPTTMVWAMEVARNVQVGMTVNVYVWSVPDVNGLGAGAENVRWVYNYSNTQPDLVSAWNTAPVFVDQQLRLNTTVYRDLLVTLTTLETGQILHLSVAREGLGAGDTYVNNVRLIGVEFEYTADA